MGEPSRFFLKLSETTEVRPAAAFPMIFGIAFGFFGTLGCAIGNLIADIISGYSASIFIPGFFILISILASAGAYEIFYPKYRNDPMTFWSYI